MLNTIFEKIKNFALKIFIKKSSNQELNKIRDDIFSDTIVEELMLTRSDIDAVNANINLTEICQIFIKTEHTRIPVYQDDLDNILGFIHIKDVFKIVASNNINIINNFNLKNILRKTIITTQSKKILDLFNEMKKKRVHIAIVVDEYGGTQGLITIEDIIEKQLGNIDDEYDNQTEDNNFIIKKNNHYIVSGRAKIDEIEEKLSINLNIINHHDYETIAGMLIAKLQFIPKVEHQININDIILCTIIEATPRIIKKIKIEILSNTNINSIDNNNILNNNEK